MSVIDHYDPEAPRRKHPGGRPSTYRPHIGEEICERLSEGESLTSICRDPDMPKRTTVNKWLIATDPDKPGMAKYPEFRAAYAQARVAYGDAMFEDIAEIADDSRLDVTVTMVDGRPKVEVNRDEINRARLRVDARKWILSKLNPAKYGERLALMDPSGNIADPTESLDRSALARIIVALLQSGVKMPGMPTTVDSKVIEAEESA